MSKIYYAVLLKLEFLKKLHLPIGQVKNKIQQPDSKIHLPPAIGHDVLCTLPLYDFNIEPIITCALSKVGITACKESCAQ